jgi:hypothetical protein
MSIGQLLHPDEVNTYLLARLDNNYNALVEIVSNHIATNPMLERDI